MHTRLILPNRPRLAPAPESEAAAIARATFPKVPTANRQLPEELGTPRPHTTLRPRSHTGLAPSSPTPRDRTTPHVRTHVPRSQRTSSCGPTCAPLAWRPRALGGEPRRPLAPRPPPPPGPGSTTAGTQTPDPLPPPGTPLPTPTRPRTRFRTAVSGRRGADPRLTGRPGPRCRRRHAQEPASEPLGRDAEAKTPDPPAVRDLGADADTPKNPLQNRRVGTPGCRPQTHWPSGTPLPTPTPKNRSQPRTVHTRTPPEPLARQLTVAAAVAERPRGRLLRDTRAHKLRP